MVNRFLVVTLITVSTLYSNKLYDKIESLIGSQALSKHHKLIDVIFMQKKNKFYFNSELNIIEIVKTLKNNGLLKLYSSTPQTYNITLKTTSAATPFIKIMQDSLKSLGFNTFSTKEIIYTNNAFLWEIEFKSEYMIDPSILSTELYKSGLVIKDIIKNSENNWAFDIDSFYAKISCNDTIKLDTELELEKPLKDIFLRVSGVPSVVIKSAKRNKWYPYIVSYTRDLQVVDIIKIDSIHKELKVEFPKNTTYMKVSDLYTLSNIKNGLIISTKLENEED